MKTETCKNCGLHKSDHYWSTETQKNYCIYSGTEFVPQSKGLQTQSQDDSSGLAPLKLNEFPDTLRGKPTVTTEYMSQEEYDNFVPSVKFKEGKTPTLSSKGVKCKCEICLEKGSITNYSEKNVKEFLRLVLEQGQIIPYVPKEFTDFIRKRAGEDLI